MFIATMAATDGAAAGNFSETVSGNLWDTVSITGAGSPSNVFSGAAKGNGSPTYEGVLEAINVGPAVAGGPCDGFDIQGDVSAYSMVRRYSNGDLLFSTLAAANSGTLCFSVGTGIGSINVDATFSGGTGKYANASGSYHASFTATRLLGDAMGGIGHGAFHGTTTGTLN